MKNCFWIVILSINSIQCNMVYKNKGNDQGNPVIVNDTFTHSNLPSGSGLAVVNDTVYVIGDDSPWLFKYSKDRKISEKLLLIEGFAPEGRIPKPVKPDFECMAQIQDRDETLLLIFGSGSKSPERDVLVKVVVQEPEITQRYSLTAFYDRLAQFSGGTRKGLNIEAAMVSGKELYLFNRADNAIFVTDWQEFLNTLPDKEAIRKLEIRHFKVSLPELKGVSAGFSGACLLPDTNKILFTATLEDTENWIADGEVLGSYLGVLDMSKPDKEKLVNIFLVLGKDGKPIKDKLESVAILSAGENGDLELLAVADNDDGTSLLLELTMKASFLKREE